MNFPRPCFFFLVICALSTTVHVSAQSVNPSDNESSVNPAETASVAKEPLSEIGLYGFGQLPLGNYSEMLKGLAGGGLSVFRRFDEHMPLSFGVRLQGSLDVPNSDRIKTWWNGAAFAGVSYGIPLTGLFSINPELDLGLWLHQIKWADNLGLSDSTQSYLDPAAQLSVALRVSTKMFGFELAPVITALPEKSSIPLMMGIRTGFLLRR